MVVEELENLFKVFVDVKLMKFLIDGEFVDVVFGKMFLIIDF